jgi:hypothetical protein
MTNPIDPVDFARHCRQRLDEKRAKLNATIDALAQEQQDYIDKILAQNQAMRESLEEILNYSGGAFSVLDDARVVARARKALELP